jgi:integrase
MAERRANGEGSKILLHKSGRYYSKVSLSSGRRVDVYGQTRDEVKNKRQALLERDRLGLMTAPDKITLGEWLEKWLGLMKPQLEDTTLAVYETRIRLYIPEGLKATRLQAIHRNQIKDMLADLAKRGLSYDIRTQSLQHLRAALDEAIDRELIAINPAHALRVKTSESDKQKRQDAVGKALTDYEMDVFLEAALGDAMYPLFYTMFSLGLRRGEALGLRWKEVDFEANTVKTVVQVKSGRRSRPTVGSLKTSRSRRTLTMSEDLAEVLRERRAAQEADRTVLGEAWTETEFVFTTTLGTIFSPRNVNRAIHRLCVKANREGLEIVVGSDHLPVDRHDKHGPLFSTVILASALGVSANFVRVLRRNEETIEGQHWITVEHGRDKKPVVRWNSSGAILAAQRVRSVRSEEFQMALEAFTLPPKPALSVRQFSSHACRHTNLTGRLRDGEKPEVVAAIAGHSNPTIPLRIYRTVFEDEKRASVYSIAARRKKLDKDRSKK